MKNKIKRFMGEYSFLSNFYPCEILYDGILYHSTENAYQAQKTDDIILRRLISNRTPAQSKYIGAKLELNSRWESSKVEIMYNLNMIKYQNPELKKLLLSTGDSVIIEGNWWGDIFWGVCLKTNKGNNILGEILMRIRMELQK